MGRFLLAHNIPRLQQGIWSLHLGAVYPVLQAAVRAADNMVCCLSRRPLVLTGTSPEEAPQVVSQPQPSRPAGMQTLTRPAGIGANLPSLPEHEQAQDSRSDVSISATTAGRPPHTILLFGALVS